MAQLKLPFGRGHITADIPDGRLAGVLQSRAHSYQAKADQPELVRQALENPIGSPRLRELAAGKNKVVILSSDHTRPVPSKVILPQLVEELRAGNPDAEITVLVATGFHRPTTEAELLDKYGETLYRHSGLRFVIHESGKKEDMVHLGTLPSGGELLINKLAAEATCAPGGVIIMVSACSDGHGGQSFYDTFAHEPDNRKIMDRFLATPSDRTIPDQWEAQILCRVLLQHPVILVTQAPREMVEAMHLHWAADLPAAIALADRLLGKADSPITVIPDGVSVIVRK